MTGHDYERVVAAYLRNKGYSRVKVTKASGDYGVDVIAHKGKKKYAVQCKYYSSPVSLGAVQEAVAGKAMYGCNAAMVVTNNTFTRSAEELEKKNGVVLIPGVNSTGITLKGVLKFVGVCCSLAVAFVLLAGTSAVISAVKSQFTAGLYGAAVLNLLTWFAFLAIIIGLPIGLKIIFKERKLKKESDSIDVNTSQERYAADTKAEQVEISENPTVPEGFDRYLDLTKPVSMDEKTSVSVAKSHYEMIQALSKLRTDDFDTYTHLYENVKPFVSGGKISVGMIQRKMKIGFNRALYLMDTLEKIGFIVPRLENTEYSGKFLVTEQEIMNLLAEIENANTPT